MFGDDDPEDAWDEGDTEAEKLGILERWIPSIRVEHEEPGHSHPRVVERIRLALETVTRFSLLTKDLRILEVLGHLRDRLLELQQEEGA